MTRDRFATVSDRPESQVPALLRLLSWYLVPTLLSPLVIMGLPREWIWPRLAFAGLWLLGTCVVMFKMYAAGFRLFRDARQRNQRPSA
jgi:hypothetical protein